MKENLILPNRTEFVWGRRYLLFQLVFLGTFLRLGASLIGIRLTPMALNLSYFTINFIVVVILCRKYLLQTMGYGLHNLRRCLLWAVLGFIGYQMLATLVSILIMVLRPDFSNINDQNLALIGKENYSLLVIGTVLLVPLTEEVFYRGIIFGSFYRRSRPAAYAVSTVVFALVHISGYIGHADVLTLLLCFLQYIPAGVCLALAYEYSGSLLAPILIHTTVNAIGTMAMR
jgi:membrane protease YdiL (CAAX protease family)